MTLVFGAGFAVVIVVLLVLQAIRGKDAREGSCEEHHHRRKQAPSRLVVVADLEGLGHEKEPVEKSCCREEERD